MVCIDSSNKPAKVPVEQWIKEGEVYTVIKVVRMGLQDNKYGVLLKKCRCLLIVSHMSTMMQTDSFH